MSLVDAPRLALSLAVLALLGACGGGGGAPTPPAAPQAATGLSYADPAGTGWRLVKDASSTPTRLVLNLVGPAGEKGRGVAFNLRADGAVQFAKFANGTYINDLGVFQLGNKHGARSVVDGTPVAKDVGAIVGGVKEGGRVLSVGAFQKDRRWPAQALDRPLYQIAIAFDAGQAAPLAAGAEIPLAFVKGRSIPDSIGDNPEDPHANRATWVYDYRIDDVHVAVGQLVAQ